MANTQQTMILSRPALPDCGAAPGDLLGGRFQLGPAVGHGGQAVIFQAGDLRRGAAPVAVKVARRDLGDDASREAAEVLRWEGGLLRRLRHPALPRLYAQRSDSRSTWIARDLVPGAPLLTLIRQGPQEPRRVMLWAALLCDLLSYLHTQPTPVVCGDLKPANLILRPDGTVALIDLGAAHTLTRRPPRKPRPRHGTPGYAPPEQLGSWGHDERSDLFSLAVTCYELITGHDPTVAPLQFDLDRLDRIAPQIAPALRWALQPDLAQRCPSAAALRSALGAPAPAPPLALGMGVSLHDMRDLNAVIQRHPRLLEPAIANGALEIWLTRSPDPSLGRLRYALRALQRAAPARHSPLDLLLSAMAPDDGSPLIDVAPARLQLGRIPLKSWRIWSRPQRLTLHNQALSPQRWELTIPAQPDAELRILVDGRPHRQLAGVLAPGARAALELVAMGNAGPRQGSITLRSGRHERAIPWGAEAAPGIPVGDGHVPRLEDLDLERADLVPALEALLSQGALARWLKATGRRSQAIAVEQALLRKPDELGRRLLIGQVLHEIAPARFPLLRLRGLDSACTRPLTAGQTTYVLIEIENLSLHPFTAIWRSRCSWAGFATAVGTVPALGRHPFSLAVSPPRGLSGAQPVALDLSAGSLPLTLVLPATVQAEGWWGKLRRLLTSS